MNSTPLPPAWHRRWLAATLVMALLNVGWWISQDLLGVEWPVAFARIVSACTIIVVTFTLLFRPLRPTDPRNVPLPKGVRSAQVEALQVLRGPPPRRAPGPESGPRWVWRCSGCDAWHVDDVDRIQHAPDCRWIAARALAWTLDLPVW